MTWRDVWYQAHWLVGITAGVVLAVVGLSGAVLSYEQSILKALNPQLMRVEPAGRTPLAPHELIALAQKAFPDKRVSAVALASEADETARVVVNERGPAAGGPANRRGTTVFVDPYTGAMLGSELRGDPTMHVVEDIHRRLAAGDTGKLIVGVSTALLLLLAATGLYLRWPKVASTLRVWFTFKRSLQGRTFLWHLHAIVGTWVLLFYVLASLTGLYWSFEWYRDGLFAMTGAPRPQGQGAPAQQPRPDSNSASARSGARDASTSDASRDAASPDEVMLVAAAWQSFRSNAPAFEMATLTLPKPGESTFEIRYLDADPAHERAYSRMSIDGSTNTVVKHERYDDKPAGHKLMSSLFVLHSGSFFGWAGTLLMMFASLAMPLFAVTGWMLYLDRRQRRARARERATNGTATPDYAQETT